MSDMSGDEKLMAFVTAIVVTGIAAAFSIAVVSCREHCDLDVRLTKQGEQQAIKSQPARIAACKSACGEGQLRAVTASGCDCR